MTHLQSEIELAEAHLRQAMLCSDTDTLDRLIADDLVFTTHFGQVLSKQADLDMHRTGMLKLHTLDPSEQRIQADGDQAVVSVRMQIAGAYDGQPFAADLRYTRVWRRVAGGAWRVAVGHSSVVQG